MIVRAATSDDCHAIATLHADSWRRTYRHILAHEYLDRHVGDDRQDLWAARFAKYDPRQHHISVALPDQEARSSSITGFVCVMLDEEPDFGALLDNLHVGPDLHHRGIGRHLMADAAHWVAREEPRWPMHLWVYEANMKSAQFYRSFGGKEVDQRMIVTPAGNRANVLRLEWRDPAALARALDDSLRRDIA